MNEQIQKLALQAGAVNVWEWASDDVLDTKSMDAEKFAELIVRECISALDDADGSVHHSECLLEHFGVES
jgi:hypothetical protein